MIKVSVIVPTYNAKKIINLLLDSLMRQNCPRSDYEIIVINDGSTDDTVSIVRKYPVFLISQKNKGAGKARNLGAQRAQGSILLFLDSDCLVPEDWIKKHLEIHKENRNIGIIGGGVKKPKEKTYLSWADFLSSWFNAHEDLVKHEVKEYLPSLNLSVKSEVFKKAGGFREKRLTGEDVDFCLRARQKGIKILFDPELAVWHQSPTLKGFFKHNFNWGYHAPFVRGEEKNLAYHFLFSGSFLRSLILFLPIVFGYTFYLATVWWPYQPLRFILCLPLIFLGKLTYGLGVLAGSWQKSSLGK